MTSVERTAYPCLSVHKSISEKTLNTCYVLAKNDLDYINRYIRGNKNRLNFAIQLKTFQNLGYFIDISEIPKSIQDFIKKQLKVSYNLQPFYDHPKTRSRHRVGSSNGAVVCAPFPSPSTSNVACRFPALRFPDTFLSKLMAYRLDLLSKGCSI